MGHGRLHGIRPHWLLARCVQLSKGNRSRRVPCRPVEGAPPLAVSLASFLVLTSAPVQTSYPADLEAKRLADDHYDFTPYHYTRKAGRRPEDYPRERCVTTLKMVRARCVCVCVCMPVAPPFVYDYMLWWSCVCPRGWSGIRARACACPPRWGAARAFLALSRPRAAGHSVSACLCIVCLCACVVCANSCVC